MLDPDSVRSEGSVIPARRLRTGGENFANDAVFLRSGECEAKRLIGTCGMTKQTRLLEVGCGFGRFPIGVLRTVGDVESYMGVDVNPLAIDWCVRHIAKTHPTFHFLHTDVTNARYNPHGSTHVALLPFQPQSYDIIYLYSVFSHMIPQDVALYLHEFARLLAPGGTVFLTAFIEEGVKDYTENPEGYQREWKGPLHCTRYDRGYFRSLVEQAGLKVKHVDHGTETNGQSAVWITK